jgi:hypothetical protein
MPIILADEGLSEMYVYNEEKKIGKFIAYSSIYVFLNQ